MFNTAKLFVPECVYIDIGQEAKKQGLFFCKGLAPDATYRFKYWDIEILGYWDIGILRD